MNHKQIARNHLKLADEGLERLKSGATHFGSKEYDVVWSSAQLRIAHAVVNALLAISASIDDIDPRMRNT